MLGQFRNFHIRQAAVGLSDREELPAFLVPHREGVIAQDVIAFAVAQLGRHHHHIERSQFFLQLEPRHAAPPRRVLALRVLDHEAFVQTPPRHRERGVDFLGRAGGRDLRELELRRHR